ncbi:MAG: GDP-mannose 4,6-dehydratase [Terriglobales bacterium]
MALILITGAAGFVGSHLVERLLERGDKVIGLDNFDPFYPREAKERNLRGPKAHSGFTFVEADLRDASGMAELLERHRPQRIAHLAAKAGVRPSLENPAGYVESNVHGTLNLLLACQRFPVEHFVFTSSSSVYGNDVKAACTEEASTDSPASPYGATKKAGEVLCFTYHQLLKIPVTCLRLFTVFGPRQRPDLAIHKFVRLLEAGKPVPFFGDGSSRRDYTFVADTVDGISRALDRPDGYQIYNLGRGNPVTLADMLKAVECALGKKAVLDRQPEQPGDVRTTWADITKAKTRLGYEPSVQFEEGVGRFLEWWRETGRG